MEGDRKVTIALLSTGITGLDAVLQGGLPEYSFNLIAGAPGTGKTTLAHQIVFANASPERPALYFSVLGEPAVKMLRYQQQMGFFDMSKVGTCIHFVNLGEEVTDGNLQKVFDRIMEETERINPSMVVVDSFRTIADTGRLIGVGELSLQAFVQKLAHFFTGYLTTSFLVGEYSDEEVQKNPVFTVADGILWLRQSVERNSIVRKLQVMKMRGQATMPGLHAFRIIDVGVQVFPRLQTSAPRVLRLVPRRRVSTGVNGLDEMLNGGIPEGDALLVAGPAGVGKTLLGMQFIDDGLKKGEPGVVAVFEEYPEEYLSRAKCLGLDLQSMIWQNQLRVLYLRPLDLSVDETLYGIREAVAEIGARRVVIDSISGFEMALAPTFRDDFHESLYRLVGALTDIGVTLMLSSEVRGNFGEPEFIPSLISFMADDIVFMRYIETEGALRKVLGVLKMGSSAYDERMRRFAVTPGGLKIGETLTQYIGIITGIPRLREVAAHPQYFGLIDKEILVLNAIIELREATIQQLRESTGMRRSDLVRALARLLALKYAQKVTEAGRVVYVG